MELTIDIAKAEQAPGLRGLDLSAFGEEDLVNLVLQRSEVLYDRPHSGEVIRAWNAGDEGPIRAAVAELGAEIAHRAAAVILAEFHALMPTIAPVVPRRIADIGCGYALFDLFAAREFGCDLLLIDLETNDRRHFGFKAEGAAYSDLQVARRVLEANGIAPRSIRTLNPEAEDAAAAGPVDLAVSFLSCGFHYPVGTYMDFFRTALAKGGAVIVDLRAATAEAQAAELATLGAVKDLAAPPKARRVMVRT